MALLFAGVSPEQELPADLIEEIMAALSWRLKHGDALRLGTPEMDILYNVSDPEEPGPWKVGRVAASLTREALFE